MSALRLRRYLPRFSLRTLVVFLLLVTSAVAMWFHWRPWMKLRVVRPELAGLTGGDLSPDGRALALTDGHRVAVVELRTGAVTKWMKPSGSEPRTPSLPLKRAVYFSRDGARIVDARLGRGGMGAGSSDGGSWSSPIFTARCNVYDAGTGEDLAKSGVDVIADGGRGFFPSDAGKMLAASGRVWDAGTDALAPTLETGAGRLLSAAMSPDGTIAVETNSEGTVVAWRTSDGKRLAVIKPPARMTVARFARFSADGGLLAVSWTDGFVRVHETRDWSTLAAELPAAVVGPGKLPVADEVAFSPAGRRVVVASRACARVWDLRTERVDLEMDHGQASVNRAEFSPNGLRVLTTATDGVARIWRLGMERSVAEIPINASASGLARFTPDSETVVVADPDGGVAVWTLCRPEELTGMLWRPEPWLTLLFAALLVWSVLRDRRALGREREGA